MNAICKRCGKLFKPRRTKLKTKPWSTHCTACGFRNVMDHLGLPTPPQCLDRYTAIPCLTREEYRRKLMEVNDQAE